MSRFDVPKEWPTYEDMEVINDRPSCPSGRLVLIYVPLICNKLIRLLANYRSSSHHHTSDRHLQQQPARCTTYVSPAYSGCTFVSSRTCSQLVQIDDWLTVLTRLQNWMETVNVQIKKMLQWITRHFYYQCRNKCQADRLSSVSLGTYNCSR